MSRCQLMVEVNELELTSPITRKKLELQFVAVFSYKFTITCLNFKLMANRAYSNATDNIKV